MCQYLVVRRPTAWRMESRGRLARARSRCPACWSRGRTLRRLCYKTSLHTLRLSMTQSSISAVHPYLNTHLTKLYFEITLGQFYNSTINIFGLVKLRVLDNIFVSKGLGYHCWVGAFTRYIFSIT